MDGETLAGAIDSLLARGMLTIHPDGLRWERIGIVEDGSCLVVDVTEPETHEGRIRAACRKVLAEYPDDE